ncbi:hypothetical protein [Streptomyces sp. NPDC089799]|uniref:hypothetical protein n=1 Tax=Streptomyces sp. NPDC089799 TaxID=3155066 RepID=UPI00342A395B
MHRSDCLNVAQRLQITVHAQRRPGDPYWTSRFNGSRTLVVTARHPHAPATAG